MLSPRSLATIFGDIVQTLPGIQNHWTLLHTHTHTPRKRSWGRGIILVSHCPLSGCLSACPWSADTILSKHALGNRCIDYSESVYTHYSLIENEHLEFSYWLDNYSSFYRFSSDFVLCITRNSVLKIVRIFDLNIENVLFLLLNSNWTNIYYYDLQ